MEEIFVTDKPLDLEGIKNMASDDGAGGMVIFIGTVRNQTKGKTVSSLEFESYLPMAEKEMKKIADYAIKKWDLKHMIIHHRIGKLDIGEIPVIIAASSAHRVVSFEACEYAIDTLKETVPIWKKEIFEDGEVWVAAHP